MKKEFLKFGILAFVACFSSCDDDFYRPNKAVRKTAREMYPQTVFAEWENQGPYAVADTHIGGKEAEVWVNASTGEWVMTEYDCFYIDLPAAVRKSFESSEFYNERPNLIDDIDIIESKGNPTYYVIELDTKPEMEIYYTEDGTFVKAVTNAPKTSDFRSPESWKTQLAK